MAARSAKTHYQILGIKPDVGMPEIKRAFRNLAKSHHPDLDHHKQSEAQKRTANERMRVLNEAYETLMDRTKRARYDASIGIYRRAKFVYGTVDEGNREWYLHKIFYPSRTAIVRTVSAYKKQLRDLSLDIYDDELIFAFEKYVDRLEQVLRQGSNALSSEPCPRSLEAAVRMMRYSIAQAADALDEMRTFCQNFDYNHLTMADSLVRISQDLSKQALKLVKS